MDLPSSAIHPLIKVAALAVLGALGLAFAVAGLGGLVVMATALVVAACLCSGIDWSREEITKLDDVVPVDHTVAPEAGAVAQMGGSAAATAALGAAPTTLEVDWRRWTRAAPWRGAIPWAVVRSPEQAVSLVVTGFVATLLAVFLLRGLTTNPVAIFCDEAEIGLEAWRFLHRTAETTPVPLFYQHFGYQLGALPVLWTAPFVALFGLDDFAVRLAGSVAMLATIAVVWLTLRRLRIPYAAVPIALYAFSPVVIHLSRTNFGLGPPMLLAALGFDRYVVAHQTGRTRPAILAGVLLAGSAYGYAGFFVIAPMIVGSLCLSELLCNGRQIRAYATIARTVGGAVLGFLPGVYFALTNDQFWKRFDDKNVSSTPLLSLERAGEIIANYPKYFSLDYLFRVGEIGVPGGFITRHSVPGAGELSLALAPVLLMAVVTAALRWRQPETRFFLPWFFVAALYPLPDVLTTTSLNAPFTIAVFGGSLCLPYLAGYAMCGLRALFAGPTSSAVPWRLRATTETVTPDSIRPETLVSAALRRSWIATGVAGGLLLWATIAGWQFYTGPYNTYPTVSADYWGWQYGANPMTDYFLAHHEEYDEFIMDGDFNQAYVFLDFYLRDPEIRARASLGDVSRLDLEKRQLFGIKRETWNALSGSQVPPKSYLRIVEIIPYPNGDDAIYLLEAR